MNLDCELVVTDWLRASGQLRFLSRDHWNGFVLHGQHVAFFNGNLLQREPYYEIDGSIEYCVPVGHLGLCRCRDRCWRAISGEWCGEGQPSGRLRMAG